MKNKIKYRKILSMSLALNVLLLNTPINSIAGTLSPDTRYETFEGDSFTINDIAEDNKIDLEVEGNTMVNAIGDVTYKSSESLISVDKNLNTITFSHEPKDDTTTTKIEFGNALVSTNKTYTLMFDIVENTLHNNNFNSVAKFNIISYNSGVHFIKEGDVGFQKIVLTQPSEITHNGKPYLEIYDDSVGKLIIKDIMLIEGDLTNKDVSYFKGMKSAGENNEGYNGIMINSNSGNLFNVKYMEHLIKKYYDINNYGYEKKDNKNTIWVQKDHERLLYKSIFEKDIKFKPNQQYIIKSNVFLEDNNINRWNALRVDVHYTDGTEVGAFLGSKGRWREYTYISDKGKTISKIIFSYGNTDTKAWLDLDSLYVGEYNGNSNIDNGQSKTINLSSGLKSLPNGVRDRIIKKNGQWMIERNIKKIVLNGSEKWDTNTEFSLNDYASFYTQIGAHDKIGGRYNILTDRFPSLWGLDSNNQACIDSIFMEEDNTVEYLRGILNLTIKKSTISGYSIENLKNYLSANPITVLYQTSSPIYEPLNTDSTINLYEGITHISNSSIIPANLRVTVDRVMNLAIKYINLAKENPTIENLSKARMWTNLLKESIKKDELQDSVDNIIEIADMTLERKTVSSNIDIYIKSENTLIMSLNTNSITFDDFSGVEDMTKENAVNIVIDSSLPYSLNAYLPSEIQNADKSNIMDLKILNIKDNSETTYQTFINTTDKITLKDNCNSGNSLVHGIDIKLKGGIAHEKDVYKTTIKFEAEQK